MTCRLYLVTPAALGSADLPFAAFAESLTAAAAAGDVASLLLRSGALGDAALRQAAEALRPVTAAHDIALLLEDRPGLVRPAACDGVHLTGDAKAVKAARGSLGEDLILGAASGDTRHGAINAGEAGADYVAFGSLAAAANSDLLAWWREVMVLPSVAFCPDNRDSARDLVRAGADFLALDQMVWQAPAGPAGAVAELNRLFAAESPPESD